MKSEMQILRFNLVGQIGQYETVTEMPITFGNIMTLLTIRLLIHVL